MTFPAELERLLKGATEGPWFKRYCDDDNHMCMTVISRKDYGPRNTGQFKDEPDTVAITFHQLMPAVGETVDCNDTTTDLIVLLRNHADAILGLVRAAEVVSRRYINDPVADDDLREALAKLNGGHK